MTKAEEIKCIEDSNKVLDDEIEKLEREIKRLRQRQLENNNYIEMLRLYEEKE